MLGEIDLKDQHGNIIIQPGLKVRHKKSQYEYTVDSIVKAADGTINVILKMPETPRFEPAPEDPGVISDNTSEKNILYEVDPDGLYFFADEEGTKEPARDEEFLAVPQEEFEKEYEVK